LKSFTALVVTVKDRDEPPLGSETEVGAAVRLKSGVGAAEMARVAVAVCDSESAAPVTVIVAPLFVADPVGAAESEAESMNWPNCPGASERLEGVAVTPFGSPLKEIVTGSLKPFTGPAVMVRARAAPPVWRVTVFGAAAMVKLGRIAGPDDEPQPRAKAARALSAHVRRGILMNGRSYLKRVKPLRWGISFKLR